MEQNLINQRSLQKESQFYSSSSALQAGHYSNSSFDAAQANSTACMNIQLNNENINRGNENFSKKYPSPFLTQASHYESTGKVMSTGSLASHQVYFSNFSSGSMSHFHHCNENNEISKYHNDLNNNVQYGQPGIENIPESMCLNNVDGNYQYNSTYLNSSVGNLNQLNYYYNMSNSDENMTMGGQFNDYNLANTSFY